MLLASFTWNRFALLSLAAIGYAGIALLAKVKAAESVKGELSPEIRSHVLALTRPQENEWRHLKVEWLTDVVAARKKAAAEDKPIVICYTGGAGYNEPLGVC